jgi:hypothetical protein
MIIGIGTISARRHSGAELEFLGGNSCHSSDIDVLWTFALLSDDFVVFLDFLTEFFQWLNLSETQSKDIIVENLNLDLFNVFFLVFSGLIVGHDYTVYNL